MSGQATGWVLRHGPTPATLDRHGAPLAGRARGLRSVLLAVADAANADGMNAHPGIEGVMRGSLYARRQAVDLLAELVAEGWLEVTAAGSGGRGLATVYRVCMDPRNSAGSASEPETVQGNPENSAGDARETVQGAPETVRGCPHTNGLTTVENNGREQRACGPTDPTFDEFWKAYPSRRGRKADRPKAHDAWKRLSFIERLDVMVCLVNYAAECRNGDTLAKDAHRWLRPGIWDAWRDAPEVVMPMSKTMRSALAVAGSLPDSIDLFGGTR